MPFKSEAQRRKFYAMANRGEISRDTVKEWENATPKDKKLPEKVSHAFSLGVADALARLGFKTASEEIRLQIPRRKFHGQDAAFREQLKAKKADCAPGEADREDEGMPADALAQALQALDEKMPPDMQDATKDKLDRATMWSGPSSLAAGDAANRVSDMGQPTNIGTVF